MGMMNPFNMNMLSMANIRSDGHITRGAAGWFGQSGLGLDAAGLGSFAGLQGGIGAGDLLAVLARRAVSGGRLPRLSANGKPFIFRRRNKGSGRKKKISTRKY